MSHGNPRIFIVVCVFHCILFVVGTYIFCFYYFYCLFCPLAVLITHIWVIIKYRRSFSQTKIRVHIIHEKILNFEPLESGQRLLSLENFDEKRGKYYYYLSVRDPRNFTENYKLDPYKLFKNSIHINRHKPYYGLFSYNNIIYVKSKDGNFMGITVNKHAPKLIYHDLSVADSNLDHLAGSDNGCYFVYINTKSQKNIRMVNSRSKKVLYRKKVDAKSVFDIFGNNRFIQFGGGQSLKILDLHTRKFLPMKDSFVDRFFHFYHKYSNR